MVTIITEKLKTQTLEDVSGESLPVPVPRSSGNSWTFSTSDLPTYKLTGRSGVWVPPQATSRGGDDLNSGTTFLRSESNRDSWRWTSQQRGAKEGVRWANWGDRGMESPVSQLQQSILEMESIPNTPPAPPKKRHCRSLSIPGEGTLVTPPDGDSSNRPWQPQTSSIWRPVAVKPSSNRRKTMSEFEVASTILRPQQSTSPATAVTCKAIAPSRRPLSKSEDLSHLPMRSPTLPEGRPASAAPAFFQPAFVPVEAATGCLGEQGNFLRAGSTSSLGMCPTDSRLEALRVRSLSMEEPIVGSSSDSESIEGEVYVESEPSSPQRIMVPRCRSQPSVLHERKCLKRRRGEDRPALDFLKMKETAYYRHCHKQGSNRYSEQYKTWSQSLASLFSDPPGCPIKLNTIASSPLDSTPKNSVSLDSFTKWMHHSDTPSSVCATVCSSLCSSPSSGKLSSPSPNAEDYGTPTPLVIAPVADLNEGQRHTVIGQRPNNNKSQRPGDEYLQEFQGEFKDHRVEDECQWDSGCSDVHESPDVLSFVDREAEEAGCSCDDTLDQERDSTIFDLELNDLDLEQIEKH